MAEDEARLADLLAQAVREAGWQATVCATGPAALTAARTGDHDVLLLAWMLPGRTGPQVIRALRDDGHRIPILLLTALLYDDSATSAALDLMGDSRLDRDVWRRSCEVGIRDSQLRGQALSIFEIGARALGGFPDGYIPGGAGRLVADFTERYPRSARCPADDQLDAFRNNPEDLSAWK